MYKIFDIVQWKMFIIINVNDKKITHIWMARFTKMLFRIQHLLSIIFYVFVLRSVTL